MSYHTECDWCGERIEWEDDQARMPVTIYHRGGKGTLAAKWSEETGQTRHFHASPEPEEVDHTGTNRMGLVPEEPVDSCYDRATAAITGTELQDPGLGMEWRLMPVKDAREGDRQRDKSEDVEIFEDAYEAAQSVWKRTSRERRESLLFEVLGDERLIIRELTERLNAELGYPQQEGEYRVRAVHESEVGNLIRRLTRDGQLLREAETFNKTHTRYRYFRGPEPATPIAKAVT